MNEGVEAAWQEWMLRFDEGVKSDIQELDAEYRSVGEKAVSSAHLLLQDMREHGMSPPTQWNMSEEGLLSIEFGHVARGLLIVFGDEDVISRSFRNERGFFSDIKDFKVADGLDWDEVARLKAEIPEKKGAEEVIRNFSFSARAFEGNGEVFGVPLAGRRPKLKPA